MRTLSCVSSRAEATTPAPGHPGDALLDLDGHQMPEERREAELLDLLGSLTPLLNEFASAADLAAHDRRGTFKAMGITGPARSVMDRA